MLSLLNCKYTLCGLIFKSVNSCFFRSLLLDADALSVWLLPELCDNESEVVDDDEDEDEDEDEEGGVAGGVCGELILLSPAAAATGTVISAGAVICGVVICGCSSGILSFPLTSL